MKEAESFYDPELAYHNFSHIHYVFAAADQIIKRCKRNNVDVDETVVYLALLFHDAGFAEDHSALGFDSKEAYSAHLSGEILKQHGYDTNTIDQVKQAILSTHCDVRCRTNEDRVVKAADLSGLADTYQVFLDNAMKLKLEYEHFNGGEISWQDWKDTAIARLQLFLEDNMELTDEEFDESGDSLFQQAVRKNVEQFQDEPENQHH